MASSYKEEIDVNKKGRYCLARWDDWGFFIDNSSKCFMWHFQCHSIIDLPRLRTFKEWREKLYKCVVTPSTHEYYDNDDDNLCTVSLFFNDELYCLICRPPYYSRWEKVMLVRKNNHDMSRLCDAVSFCNGEKLCTLFENGKLGIIQLIPKLRSFISPISFRAPTDRTAVYKRRQLVSWQDQLFLVQQKLGSPSILEVWLANFEAHQFDRIFNLDGFNIFLIRGFSAAISSSELEEKNCVYLTEDNADGGHTLYAFHIGDQILSTTKQFRVLVPHNSVPLLDRLWATEDNGTGDDEVKKWSSSKYAKTLSRCNTSEPVVDTNICNHLTLDLQRKISGYLISQDAHSYMNFRLVCKLWRSVAPPLRWKVVDQATRSCDQDSMWLLSLNQKDGLCTFYNPFRNLTFYMSNNDLVGCEIRYFKDGWLLVSRGKSLFLLELSSKQIIYLPEREDDYFCDTMSLSASPTHSSVWLIFGIACLSVHRVRISYLRAGDDNWTSMTMDNNGSAFLLSCSSPVYFGEEFCVIGLGGKLGAFGFLEDGNPYWVVRDIFQLYSLRSVFSARHYLVQRDHFVLYSVIVTGKCNVRVYELEFGEKIKVRLVKEVKNWLLFISEASSVAVHDMNVTLDDALLFPCFNTSNEYIYYSLEAAAFKKMKDNCCTDKTQLQKELLNRVWIRCELAPLCERTHCKAEQNISIVASN